MADAIIKNFALHPEQNTAPHIAALSTAVPSYPLTREDVKRYMGKVFLLGGQRLEAAMSIVDNSEIKQRYMVYPLDYTIEPRSLAQINHEYQEQALRLAREVTVKCLKEAALEPSEIDFLITVSCTGIMIPSLDAHLINDLGFRKDIRRIPITELGCAAGGAAISLARTLLAASPSNNALIIAVELPSLTFQRRDLSQANLISCTLFGDGAAAALITGHKNAGPQILDTDTYLLPDSLDAMGFELRDSGFHIVLSREVPQLIRTHIKALVARFLTRNGLRLDQLSAFVLHPGGKKLLTYMEEELGLQKRDLQPSWDILSNYGNLSSATILFVLQEWLRKKNLAAGSYGLMAAFGPGFSSELALLRWV